MRADSDEPLMLGVPAQGAASGGVPGPADGIAPVGIVAMGRQAQACEVQGVACGRLLRWAFSGGSEGFTFTAAES